jgi:hypothetical protein
MPGNPEGPKGPRYESGVQSCVMQTCTVQMMDLRRHHNCIT